MACTPSVRPVLLFCGLLSSLGCSGSTQSVQSDAPEWRRRMDQADARYAALDKEVDRLLSLLPRAAGTLDPAQLQRAYRDNRKVSDLVHALEKQIAAAREGLEGVRYRLAVRCGTGRDDGSYSVWLLRRGAKPKAKGARLKVVDRASCPSQLHLDLSAAQAGEGDFRLEVGFDSRPGRSYQFAFELRRTDGDKEEVVCSGGTAADGPPTLQNACEVSLRQAAPAELPVAR